MYTVTVYRPAHEKFSVARVGHVLIEAGSLTSAGSRTTMQVEENSYSKTKWHVFLRFTVYYVLVVLSLVKTDLGSGSRP